MSSAFVLVILITGHDDVAATDAAIRAARSAVPPEASLVVQRMNTALDDDDAIRIQRRESADAVAIVAWSDESGRRVHLHVHRDADDRWIDRDIAFEGADASRERGRSLGFALASMVPEGSGSRPEPVKIQAKAVGAPSLSTRVEPAGERETGTLEPTRLESAPHAAIDAAVLGAVGVEGSGGGVGARGAVAWLTGKHVGLRVDASVRRGEVAPAQATSVIVGVGPGISFDLVPTHADRIVGLGFRLNALAILHAHSHLSNETDPVHASRWLPGASGFIEGSLRLSDGAAVLISGGSEVAFGRTDVFVRGRKVAVVPPLRAVADAGIRVRF